ncbi:MAG: hypothetical protein ACREHF_05410 [Rhizomicrobium sp.]
MGWSIRIAVAVVALLILGAAALTVYAGTISPPHKTYVEVLPNAQFPG